MRDHPTCGIERSSTYTVYDKFKWFQGTRNKMNSQKSNEFDPKKKVHRSESQKPHRPFRKFCSRTFNRNIFSVFQCNSEETIKISEKKTLMNEQINWRSVRQTENNQIEEV